jgi:hypothetical protein
MNMMFRFETELMARVRADLSRPHPFAYERVGFISIRAAWSTDGLLLLADNYFPVADEDYVDDPSVGAMLGQEAIRKALEIALIYRVGVVHVHQHELGKRLWFSTIDLDEQVRFVPDFFKVCSNMPHGALVLSAHSAAGRVWLAPDEIRRITEFNSIGAPLRTWTSARDGSTDFTHDWS